MLSWKRVYFYRPYQTLKEASGPRDYDEDLPHQINDDGHLFTFRTLIGLGTKRWRGGNIGPT